MAITSSFTITVQIRKMLIVQHICRNITNTNIVFIVFRYISTCYLKKQHISSNYVFCKSHIYSTHITTKTTNMFITGKRTFRAFK